MTMPAENRSFYILELLTSSGPRKCPEDYRREASLRELGEDAAGMLFFPDGVLFWLADGTSNEAFLLGFSSRLLAQDLGLCLQRCAMERFRERPLSLGPGLMADLRNAIQNLWQARLTERSASFSTEKIRGRFPVCSDGVRHLGWSTTFLAGLLDLRTGRLQAVNLGDAGGAVYTGASDTPIPIPPSRRRFFLSVDFPPDGGEPRVSLSSIAPPQISVQSFDEVTGFFCLTDGNPPMPLSRFLEEAGRKPFRCLEPLLRRMRLLSFDDRTLLIGRRSPSLSDHEELSQPWGPSEPCA